MRQHYDLEDRIVNSFCQLSNYFNGADDDDDDDNVIIYSFDF